MGPILRFWPHLPPEKNTSEQRVVCEYRLSYSFSVFRQKGDGERSFRHQDDRRMLAHNRADESKRFLNRRHAAREHEFLRKLRVEGRHEEVGRFLHIPRDRERLIRAHHEVFLQFLHDRVVAPKPPAGVLKLLIPASLAALDRKSVV